MRAFFILLVATALIVVTFMINPGLGIFVAILSYGAVEGLLSR